MVFVCVFPCFDAKKMQDKKRKSWVFNFLGNHILGEEHENNQSFFGEEHEKNLHILPKNNEKKIRTIEILCFKNFKLKCWSSIF